MRLGSICCLASSACDEIKGTLHVQIVGAGRRAQSFSSYKVKKIAVTVTDFLGSEEVWTWAKGLKIQAFPRRSRI